MPTMAGTLLDLANRMDALAVKVDEANNERSKAIALTIVGDLTYHTPVDTSKALSNWVVTLDAAAVGKIGPHIPGKHGSTYRASAQETIDAAKRVLAGKKSGQRIFITNNQPYIKRLNDGYSKQVPSGFVERAVLLARKTATKLKLRK